MPRIPRNYRKYLLEREFRTLPPERLEEILAPNSRSAREYVERYYPDPSSVRFSEVYGPFMPSEERMIRPRGFSAALQREAERRKQDAIDSYYRFTPVEDRMDPDYVSDFAGNRARQDLEVYLDERRSRLPVLPEIRYKDARRPSRYDFMSPTFEAARDRLRMEGFDDIPYPEDSPFNRYR